MITSVRAYVCDRTHRTHGAEETTNRYEFTSCVRQKSLDRSFIYKFSLSDLELVGSNQLREQTALIEHKGVDGEQAGENEQTADG